LIHSGDENLAATTLMATLNFPASRNSGWSPSRKFHAKQSVAG